MSLQAITSNEPIPGYQLRERIGSGGYGEVWRADAPGGLGKAIKLVYGVLTEDRAARELKSLNRIKSVRHPFLLSLERIEIVDGQLLIVTELAEGSLKERFTGWRKEGRQGIPWEELIGYLRDTADVLDYMSREYSLQHLDIKPENLLLLAGRVKVADFGLVKDIHEATASMMGGLTPLYAPPEVFDGQPSLWSDQYSLAIVYQEMLTGELPFPGTTAMQLARQHLSAQPRLAALPEHDQAVIARALSKSSEDRFGSCSELVEALRNARSTGPPRARHTGWPEMGPAQAPRSGGSEKSHSSGLYDRALSTASCRLPGKGTVPRVHASSAPRDLDPIRVEQGPVSVQPTLFLGAGGSAGRVMWRLRKRLVDRFQTLEAVPSLRMLLIDTDAKGVMELLHRQGGFRPDEVLTVPLRRPKEYRAMSRQLLEWLSRRWLYNIPRSLRTEGLRPLGRLALIDHAEQVVERMKTAIETATSDWALEQSRETTGLDFHSGPMRVVVIASIPGGTGGGMVADLAYLARHLLQEAGVANPDIFGLLTHSTPRDPRISELAAVNAYATLTELNHYGGPKGYYPGEKAFGLPEQRDDQRPFNETYVVDLGAALSEEELEEAVDAVSEYLYLDTATAANRFFRACRASEPEPAGTHHADTALRSFGVYQHGGMRDHVVAPAVEQLCCRVVERWGAGTCLAEGKTSDQSIATVSQSADDTRHPVYSRLRMEAEKLAASWSLDVDELVQQASGMMEEELGESVDDFVEKLLEELTSPRAISSQKDGAGCIESVVQRLDSLLGARRDGMDASAHNPAAGENALTARHRKRALECARAICDWVTSQVEGEECRIQGAQWAARWFINHCGDLEQRATALHAPVTHELSGLQQRLASVKVKRGRGKERETAGKRLGMLREFCRLRCYQNVVAGVARVARLIRGRVARVSDELQDLERELHYLGSQFEAPRPVDAVGGDEAEMPDALVDSTRQALTEHMTTLVETLDGMLQENVLRPAGGLWKLLMPGRGPRNDLPATMRDLARPIIVGVVKTLDVSEILFHEEKGSRHAVETLSEGLDAATPRLLACGGARRLLVISPSSASQTRPVEMLQREMHIAPSVVENAEGDFILCCEAEGISLTQAAVGMIDGRAEFAEAAARVHTRNDVQWSGLPDLA
ncbi:MAG: tubulin-like doman-containing protein [Planctomycetota bacterium]